MNVGGFYLRIKPRNLRSNISVCSTQCEKEELIIKKVQSTSINTARIIAGFAADKKAENIIILDMRKVANFCDYFVICSGDSDRQLKAIAQGIDEGLKDLGINLHLKHGMKSTTWILLDTGDVVVHIFETQAREFYGLEYLWQDAKQVAWKKSNLKR